MQRGGHGGKIGCDVVLESVFADMPQQLLQTGNFDDSCAAKRI
jgi:hypothetical protein